MQKMEMLVRCRQQSQQLKKYLIRPRGCPSKQENKTGENPLERLDNLLGQLRVYKNSLSPGTIDHSTGRAEKIQ